MYIVMGRMLRGRTIVDAGQLRALVYAAAEPGDGLEHVYAETDLEGAGTVLFLCATSAERAEATAVRIVDRLLAQDELLGWEWEGRRGEV
ncbi:hypothetical protein SBI_06803 [Streptomyces bingchenggensis BCW-1]|uniref:Uncharacterized protein n=1 Tax=Streptomyces bingchenggensis (strain BCW-1) TaxID=749414 RepID=D7BZL8_STRBB|nr:MULTISPECIES: hypothetical protein [Streptomyces]ADI09923.1 hypothetical protein SBI_06803 [Streptomyces bingchenggensis BCW-1]